MGGLVAPNWEIGCLGLTHWAVITVWGVSAWYKLQTAPDFCLLIMHCHISVATLLSSQCCKGGVVFQIVSSHQEFLRSAEGIAGFLMLSQGLARTDKGDFQPPVALVSRWVRDHILSCEVLWDPVWV